MRIAYFSPLNPVFSGISDYSEDLLPYLVAYAGVDVFIDRGYRPENAELREHLAVYRAGRYPRTRRRYDAVLYHIGNNPPHDYILKMLARYPGVVVLHDYVLHHLVLWRAFRYGDGSAYHDAMLRYGEAGWQLAQRMMRGRFSEEAFLYPLNEEVIGAATAVIAHSDYVAGLVRAQRPELPVAVVPMGVPLPELPDREQARQRLGLDPDALVLASFGHVNPYKRLEPALRAFRRLRAEHPRALFCLVGQVSANYDLTGLLRRLNLEEAVRVTGYTGLGTFFGYMAAADLCLNLRHPTAGETSASLLRLLGAGLPTLVSRTGAFAELPAEVAIQVDIGEEEEEQIYAFLSYLAGHPGARGVLGANARRHVTAHHTLEGAAAGYARFLARLNGQEEPAGPRPPLFLPQTARSAPLPEPDAVPAAQGSSPSLPAEILGQALADLGLTEDDRASIQAVAETAAEMAEIFSQRQALLEPQARAAEHKA